MSLPQPHHPAEGPTATAADRRRGDRHACKATRLSKVSVAGPQGPAGEAAVTCIVDFSTHGVGLIHPAEIRPGQQFYLDTESTPGHLLARRLLRCNRCTPMEGGRFLIGAEFVG
jgi:hypothetical protein